MNLKDELEGADARTGLMGQYGTATRGERELYGISRLPVARLHLPDRRDPSYTYTVPLQFAFHQRAFSRAQTCTVTQAVPKDVGGGGRSSMPDGEGSIVRRKTDEALKYEYD